MEAFMKHLISISSLLILSCSDYYEPTIDQSFESGFQDDFSWKSTSSHILEFQIPDFNLRKTILVEVQAINSEGFNEKINSQFLPPGKVYRQEFQIPNHISQIQLVITQGDRVRQKSIFIEDFSDIKLVYLDSSSAKGDLQ